MLNRKDMHHFIPRKVKISKECEDVLYQKLSEELDGLFSTLRILGIDSKINVNEVRKILSLKGYNICF
jgi:hypothetical protein